MFIVYPCNMVRRKASSAVARGMDRQTDIALHKNTGIVFAARQGNGAAEKNKNANGISLYSYKSQTITV